MYHALLFFHVLAAFFLVAAVVMFSSFVLGGPLNRPSKLVAEILWGVGGLGTLALGIWLALNRPEYELWDGWIIAAIVLWVIGSAIGGRIAAGYRRLASGGGSPDPATLVMNLALVVTVLVILIDMIYKPGAS